MYFASIVLTNASCWMRSGELAVVQGCAPYKLNRLTPLPIRISELMKEYSDTSQPEKYLLGYSVTTLITAGHFIKHRLLQYSAFGQQLYSVDAFILINEHQRWFKDRELSKTQAY